ncbi:MAG: hypothetical protein RL173_1653 [Fibrobacterota bacterium]|jgi:transcriptional regulator with XRE-family HTH domain
MKIDTQLLRQLRDERSWTQEHLAEVAGVSLRTVQRIEREGNASADSRLALAAAFGVDVSIFVGKAGEPDSPEPAPAVVEQPQNASSGRLGEGSFLRHLVVYLAVCSFLVYLDFSSGSAYHWSFWPVLGWGLGLLLHGLSQWSRGLGSCETETSDKNRRQSFPDRVRIFLVMSAMFLVIDFVSNGTLTWAFYPILGWGAGLLLNYSKTRTT